MSMSTNNNLSLSFHFQQYYPPHPSRNPEPNSNHFHVQPWLVKIWGPNHIHPSIHRQEELVFKEGLWRENSCGASWEKGRYHSGDNEGKSCIAYYVAPSRSARRKVKAESRKSVCMRCAVWNPSTIHNHNRSEDSRVQGQRPRSDRRRERRGTEVSQ